MLTKSQSVLHFRLATNEGAVFGRDLTEQIEDRGRLRSLRMDTQDWQEMGSPREITITVEPGDRLN